MSANAYCCAVLGMRVDAKKLLKLCRLPQNNCAHPKPDGAKYCPECGKRTAVEAMRDPNDLVKPLVVIFSTDQHDAVVANSRYASATGDINASAAEATGSKGHLPSSMHAYETDLRGVLEPLGLWDPTQLGIWAVGRCSY